MSFRVAFAGLVGTSLEWYDFFLYGSAAALVFGKLFFPGTNQGTGTLLAFATFSTAWIARPLGGVVFGHLGDRLGRRDVLVYTLVISGLSTVAIGLLPTYAQAGITAPILLVVMRLLQGFGLGGEWAGAVVLSVEHSDQRRRGLAGAWPQVGSAVGNLLATAVLWFLNGAMSEDMFLFWGWRIPFLLSGILVVFGLFVRIGLAESPVFEESRNGAVRHPLIEVIRRHPRALAVVLGGRIGADIQYYIFALYVLTYVTGHLGLPRSVALQAVVVGLALQLVLIPLCGALSDRIGRRPLFILGAVVAALWGFAFFPLLNTRRPGLIVLAVVVALIAHSAMYGPQGAMIAELFSTRLRYSGASMGYQLAGIVGGGLAPIVAIQLLARTGTTISISYYVAATLAVSALAGLFTPETARLRALTRAAGPDPTIAARPPRSRAMRPGWPGGDDDHDDRVRHAGGYGPGVYRATGYGTAPAARAPWEAGSGGSARSS